jgi:hypothetical protein
MSKTLIKTSRNSSTRGLKMAAADSFIPCGFNDSPYKEALAEIERLQAERDAWEATANHHYQEVFALRAALQLLHDNIADYVRVNNLGDPYQNADMRAARDALREGK